MKPVGDFKPYGYWLWSGIMDRRVKPGDDAAEWGNGTSDMPQTLVNVGGYFHSILVIS
jgi:hypothetical protein